jgi:protein TonB
MPHKQEKHPIKKKKFIQLPKYPGGSPELKRFLADNLQYPAEAIDKQVGGDVFVKFSVDDEGNVTEARIDKGIGSGCDEEALRLVRMLKYEPVRNRGVRVTAKQRIRIPFRLKRGQPQIRVSYQPVPEKKAEKPSPDKGNEKVYTYTIKLN